MAYRDYDEETWDDEEGDDFVDNDISETLPCPECGQPVYEDAVQCPSCGHYICWTESGRSRQLPWWIVVGFLAALAAMGGILGLGLVAH